MGCNPAVSVIIPCYNRENLIGEAIESALNQGPDVEVIVVDDGSEDASWTTIQSFSQVRSFRQSNAGPSAARNFGLRQASGNYIKFLDSDDLLVEGAIAALQQAQRSLGPRQIAFGLAAVFGSQNGQERTYGYADLGAGPIAGGSLLYGTMPSCLPLYPRDALLDAGDFNEQLRISEDYELAVRLHLKGYQFIQFMVLVVQVREHVSHRLSREYGAFGFQQHLRAFELSREHLKHATHNADYSAE
ncbi:MAG: glycosyltransferase family 2 protein, partial [Bradyrhizobiaceae bacterium]|nr:glycosyltransferase family 2 protein [Bradyrhizobiaceae bacterium]